MLAMPTPEHPQIDTELDSLVEPAQHGVFFADYLRLLDQLSASREFAVYLAQLNLLRLPSLLAALCLPALLPPSKLSLVNLWVGGSLMRNGLHFDLFDNLLFQLRGRKRALLFPPGDGQHLYYTAANIRRLSLELPAGFVNGSSFESVRQNVAKLNIFDAALDETYPAVRAASPLLCELRAGDALFLPRGWHHAVISEGDGARNVAVNMWYDLQGKEAAREKMDAFHGMFQKEGCRGTT